MKRRWLFITILVVPIIGFAVSEGIQMHFNSQLRTALRAKFPNAERLAISSLTVDQLCEESGANKFRAICKTNRNLNLMSTAALLSGGIGLALLLAIKIAGSISKNNRSILLATFKPGLYITSVILIILIAIHAAVAIGAIYYGEPILVKRLHVGIILMIAIGAFCGITAMAKTIFSMVHRASTFVIGTSVTRDEAPELWNQVDYIADKLNALRPQHIVVGLDSNFFVTEADVACLNGNFSGRTMYCSIPLSRILTKDEFSSVIGHELGHFKGLDTKFSVSFYPIYRGTISSLASLHRTGGGNSAFIALLPAIAILSYFLECFSVSESRISRDRELAADQAGASIAGAEIMGASLVKIHAFSGHWGSIQKASIEALQSGKALSNMSKTFAESIADNADAKVLEGITETQLSHPTDSHPPLGIRLDSLGVTLEEVASASLSVTPSDAAITFIHDFEQKEEEISKTFQMILAKKLEMKQPAA